MRAQSKNKFALTALRSTAGTTAPTKLHLFRQSPLGRFRRLTQPRVSLPLKFTTNRPRALRFGALVRRPRALPRDRVTVGTNFSLVAGENISARTGTSKEAALLAAIRRQTPFETYRPRL